MSRQPVKPIRQPSALSVHTPLKGAHTRLACFAHAGGAASAFGSLKRALSPHGIEVCALQPPGRENRLTECCADSAAELAEEFAAAIGSLPPLPTAYFGHSMGALIAFLTARLHPPLRLFASAGVSPSTKIFPGITHALPKDAFRKRLFAMGGVPQTLREQPDLLDIFEPIIRADYQLLDKYLHHDHSPAPCPITVYVADGDKTVPPESATQWQSVSRDPITVRRFEGGHFYLYQQTAAVAATLADDLRHI